MVVINGPQTVDTNTLLSEFDCHRSSEMSNGRLATDTEGKERDSQHVPREREARSKEAKDKPSVVWGLGLPVW